MDRVYNNITMQSQDNNFLYLSDTLKSKANELLHDGSQRRANNTYNVVVVGAGYVGLSLSVMLSESHYVTIVDIDRNRVSLINNNKPTIKDSLIERYFEENKNHIRNLHISATTDTKTAYKSADYIVLAVPTDSNPETNYFDCSQLDKTIEDIVNSNSTTKEKGSEPTVVIKSTVPVGYTERAKKRFSYANILFCPEFLRESKALYDNLHPSRIIIGSGAESLERAVIFSCILSSSTKKKDSDILFMEPSEAEAVKLFSNTFLALRVSFFNELDSYAEINGLDTASIIKGVSEDPRIGDYYNNPSFGYGGYCLPKDTKQLLANYKDTPQDLISAIVSSNSVRKDFMAERALLMAKSLKNRSEDNTAGDSGPLTIGVYRLVMKSDSDNFRESSVIGVIKRLMDKAPDVSILIYEPLLEPDTVFCGGRIINDIDAFKKSCDCIIANRYDPCLNDVNEIVYTRDLYRRD